jgi:hypothetical protein
VSVDSIVACFKQGGEHDQMTLPSFNSKGELPEGVHQATMEEVLSRFGTGTPQRQLVTTKLLKIYQLAKSNEMEHFAEL